MVTIPFNKEVLATINVSANVGVNVALSNIEELILEELVKSPKITAASLSLIINKSKRTAERYLKSLQENGYIEREGSDKKGYWKVLK